MSREPGNSSHAPGGSTRLTNGSAGVFYYNNTILTETSAGSSSNVHWRNNLMLPENSAPATFNVNTNTNYSSSDDNGFGMKTGAETAQRFRESQSPTAPRTRPECRRHRVATAPRVCPTSRTSRRLPGRHGGRRASSFPSGPYGRVSSAPM